MIRKFFIAVTSASVILMSSGVTAAGNIYVSKTIAIDAPAAAVWAKVKDFNALNTWHPAVARTEILAGENNKVGATRLLTLNDGGTIEEDLLSWDEATMTYTYNIIESVLPVSDYEATLTLEPITDTSTKVIWSASFNAGKGADDDTARNTIGGIFDAGLENLRSILTSQ
jgi:mxaD protein